jgi:elongation factor Ts
MEISAQQVKELREKTGAGMMECKKALADSSGSIEEAIKLLRERGIARAATKTGRETSEGLIAPYIHPGDKLGVLVEIACETDFVARTEQFRQFARNVAMHIAASSPSCVQREEIDPKLVEQEREIYHTQAKNEGKPEKILDKIVDGKLEKYFAEVVLMEQPYVKDNDKTIGDYLKETIGSLGENIQIKRFCRFRLGE